MEKKSKLRCFLVHNHFRTFLQPPKMTDFCRKMVGEKNHERGVIIDRKEGRE